MVTTEEINDAAKKVLDYGKISSPSVINASRPFQQCCYRIYECMLGNPEQLIVKLGANWQIAFEMGYAIARDKYELAKLPEPIMEFKENS